MRILDPVGPGDAVARDRALPARVDLSFQLGRVLLPLVRPLPACRRAQERNPCKWPIL